MKNKINLITITLLLLCQSVIAQSAFRHASTKANTKGHITYIDHAATNGKSNAILIVTQVQTNVKNTNEIGVWYSKGKWTIFNQNRKPMPANMRFNVLALDPAKNRNAFVHTVTKSSNTSKHISIINSGYLNGKKNKFVLATNRFGKYNVNPSGVWYNGSRWTVYNENLKAMPIGTKFNILVLDMGTLKGMGSLKGSAFVHNVTGSSKGGTIYRTILNHSATNNKPSNLLFTQTNWKSKYNKNTYGVYYLKPKWTVLNQNRGGIVNNVQFNVLSIEPSYLILTDPIIVTRYDWIKDVKLDPGKVVVAPYDPNKPEPEVPDVTDTGIHGPNVLFGTKIKDLLADPSLNEIIDNMNLYSYLYKDLNDNSGHFYYLPDKYSLKWNKNNNAEYSVSIDYQSAGNGEVIINASLYNEIYQQDLDLLKTLIGKKLNKEIFLIPMWMRSNPALKNLTLNNYNVENVNINIPSDFLEEPIQLNWNMESNIDEITFGITEAGISGSMEFFLWGDSSNLASNINIPIQIKVEDPLTYGRQFIDDPNRFLRGYENLFDYPIILEKVLYVDNQNRALSVDLDDKKIEPGAKERPVSFLKGVTLAGKFNDVKYSWVKYSLDTECVPCRDSVKNKILGGISATRVRNITIEIFDPLEYTQSRYVKLKMRSSQADPNGRTVVELPSLKIEEDDQSFVSGNLFVSEGSDLEYEYQITLVANDGSKQNSPWLPSTEEDLIIGRAMLDLLFPKEEEIEEEDLPMMEEELDEPVESDDDEDEDQD